MKEAYFAFGSAGKVVPTAVH
ncbi:protein of unknown function [Pseudodesulfovibrio piezophilus C1TLV30]|uniref:Uncharacterized protein n=1 Tax=Pseudodesulfovibrio piezophilus (strain DSM 21447 / JCM 15486 / C1TLV30) TaxID=1322246 RepID=M1WWS3_PSEP2|nr:protein of unknown function [Pseudodesulfovibrio piezophilus C1TLV30]